MCLLYFLLHEHISTFCFIDASNLLFVFTLKNGNWLRSVWSGDTCRPVAGLGSWRSVPSKWIIAMWRSVPSKWIIAWTANSELRVHVPRLVARNTIMNRHRMKTFQKKKVMRKKRGDSASLYITICHAKTRNKEGYILIKWRIHSVSWPLTSFPHAKQFRPPYVRARLSFTLVAAERIGLVHCPLYCLSDFQETIFRVVNQQKRAVELIASGVLHPAKVGLGRPAFDFAVERNVELFAGLDDVVIIHRDQVSGDGFPLFSSRHFSFGAHNTHSSWGKNRGRWVKVYTSVRAGDWKVEMLNPKPQFVLSINQPQPSYDERNLPSPAAAIVRGMGPRMIDLTIFRLFWIFAWLRIEQMSLR